MSEVEFTPVEASSESVEVQNPPNPQTGSPESDVQKVRGQVATRQASKTTTVREAAGPGLPAVSVAPVPESMEPIEPSTPLKPEAPKPWYTSVKFWAIVLLVLLIGGLIAVLVRRQLAPTSTGTGATGATGTHGTSSTTGMGTAASSGENLGGNPSGNPGNPGTHHTTGPLIPTHPNIPKTPLVTHPVTSPITPPATPTPPNKPSETVETFYGNLNGDVVHDTQVIFPVNSVVTLYSPFAEAYLRMIDATKAVQSPDVIPSGQTTVECTSQDPTAKDAQWIVKPGYVPTLSDPKAQQVFETIFPKSVRLDCLGYDALYLREIKTVSGPIVFQPGVGEEWANMWSTTVNFVDPSQFGSDNSHVIIIGAMIAAKANVHQVTDEQNLLLGTTKQGSLMSPDHTIPDTYSVWRVQVIGEQDPETKNIVYY